MSDVPKIVRDRLQAAVPRDAHPDADLLTAFAEHALSGAEREDIVRHLARCGDCREVVALSIPPLEVVASPATDSAATSARQPVERSRSWFAWPHLRWAAMAAGVVVVASVVLLRTEKQGDFPGAIESPPIENKVQGPLAEARSETAQGDVKTKVKPEARTNSAARPASPLSSLVAIAPPARSDRSLADENSSFSNEAPQSKFSHARAARGLDTARADKLTSSTGARQYIAEQDKKLDSPSSLPPPPTTMGGITASGSIGSSAETVAVTSQAVAVESAPMEEKSEKAMTRYEPQAAPVEKTKPAAKAEAASQPNTDEAASPMKVVGGYLQADSAAALQKMRAARSKDAPAQWSLSNGKLQRSQDAGATWQVALQLQHPLLAFGARGSDVWAGGQAGTLVHSSDNGATWTMLQPSANNAALTADIVAIDVRGPAEIVLSTSNHESWTTLDAGKTWDKK